METEHASHGKNALFALALLLCVAAVFGGGGVRYGLSNLVVQLVALGVLAWNYVRFHHFCRNAPLTLKALVLATVLLPILHALPLPALVWTSLPGREAMVQSYTLIGADRDWASLSVASSRSWVAASGLIVPIAILSIGWSLTREQLAWLGWIVAGLGIVTLLIGAPQALNTGSTGSFYPETPMPGVLFGTFANRNSAGVFLVCAFACAAVLPSPRSFRYEWIARIGICALLLVAIILTRSRTALVLAMVPVIMVCLRVFLISRAKRRTSSYPHARRGAAFGVAATGLAALGFAALVGIGSSGRLDDTLSRFEATTDARVHIWEDAAFSAQRYWPAGSGMGTFDEVFQLDESLENMTQRRAGRAHNDYLEVAVEAGLPGLFLIASWFVLLGYYTIRIRRSVDPCTGLAGAATLLVIAGQSTVDYPLRNQTLLAIASLALLLLARSALQPLGPTAQKKR